MVTKAKEREEDDERDDDDDESGVTVERVREIIDEALEPFRSLLDPDDVDEPSDGDGTGADLPDDDAPLTPQAIESAVEKAVASALAKGQRKAPSTRKRTPAPPPPPQEVEPVPPKRSWLQRTIWGES